MADSALIAGYGEIGQALGRVLGKVHRVSMHDARWETWPDAEPVDVLHVCFPWSEEFLSQVQAYQERYRPLHTVIHSTVPVGTSARAGAVHSPVIGTHPRLARSLTTFTKFLGGPDAGAVADHFRRAGMRVYLTDKAETTELMKLCSTTFYALCIEWTKEVKRLCDDHSVPFEAWTLFVQAYNEGYARLGYPEYVQPNLVPIMQRLGGHCLLPNVDMFDSVFCGVVRLRNQGERTEGT